MEEENVSLNIPIYEILLGLGIISIIVGVLAPLQKIGFLGMTIWLDPDLSMICLPIGSGLVCGYITRKILLDNKSAFFVGLVLGIIGVIIAVCIRPKSNANKYNNDSNKYEELEKLAKLKQGGVLTEKEFEIEKEKILK